MSEYYRIFKKLDGTQEFQTSPDKMNWVKAVLMEVREEPTVLEFEASFHVRDTEGFYAGKECVVVLSPDIMRRLDRKEWQIVATQKASLQVG